MAELCSDWDVFQHLSCLVCSSVSPDRTVSVPRARFSPVRMWTERGSEARQIRMRKENARFCLAAQMEFLPRLEKPCFNPEFCIPTAIHTLCVTGRSVSTGVIEQFQPSGCFEPKVTNAVLRTKVRQTKKGKSRSTAACVLNAIFLALDNWGLGVVAKKEDLLNHHVPLRQLSQRKRQH